jgi:hypothetical protein
VYADRGESEVTGVMILAKSAAWIKGWKKAHTTLQRSWFRRFFVALFIWCVLVGSGIGFLWESANIFMHLTSGESLKVKTVTKWQGYFRIHPRYPKEEGR